MTGQAIFNAQNLHTPRYLAGKHFHNAYGCQEYRFFFFFGPENLEKFGSPLARCLDIASY